MHGAHDNGPCTTHILQCDQTAREVWSDFCGRYTTSSVTYIIIIIISNMVTIMHSENARLTNASTQQLPSSESCMS